MLLPSRQNPKLDVALAELPRWQRALVRWRVALASVYFVGVVIVAWAVFFNGRLFDLDARGIGTIAIPSILFFAMQALLLSGAPHFRWPKPTRRRWMYVSLATGALMAGLLTFGFIGAITSLLGKNLEWMGSISDSDWIDFAVVIGIPWLFWLGIFVFLWTGAWLGKFRRMYRFLVAGTLLEMLVTIPVDVAVRRRTKCYCNEGTFFSLIIGITMIFWTFGPGVVLLFFNIRGRLETPQNICAHCGYDLRGLPEPRCPECGTPFRKSEIQMSKSETIPKVE